MKKRLKIIDPHFLSYLYQKRDWIWRRKLRRLFFLIFVSIFCSVPYSLLLKEGGEKRRGEMEKREKNRKIKRMEVKENEIGNDRNSFGYSTNV